jgi:hypothetical protein
MDKKRLVKTLPEDDLKGFEEFIEGQPTDSNFLPRGNAPAKKEVSFEHFTFLTNDSTRLNKIKDLLMDKIPFATRHEQGQHLIGEQSKELKLLKKHLFEICHKPDSAYRKSLGEILDTFFEPPST